MATEIKVPTLGESVTSATVARWMKQPGEAVAADEPLVELETDKVTVEVNAPAAGVLTAISVPEGAEVEVGRGARRGRPGCRRRPLPDPPPTRRPACVRRQRPLWRRRRVRPRRRPSAGQPPPARRRHPPLAPAAVAHAPLPAAAKLMEEQHVAAEAIGAGTGKDGRITKGDVLEFLNRPAPAACRAAAGRCRRVPTTRARSGCG